MYAYVFNGAGCLLGLVALAIGILLYWAKIDDTTWALAVGGVLLVDLGLRTRNQLSRHPAMRDSRWLILPSTGGHFNYVPMWIWGVILLCIPLGIWSFKAYVNRANGSASPPVVQNPPGVPGPRVGPQPQNPVTRPPKTPQKPTSEGANFEYDVKVSQPEGQPPTYEVSVTSRHDKPLKSLSVICSVVVLPPGKPPTETMTERNVTPGQRLSVTLKPDRAGTMILINGAGWAEDGTMVSFSCRWPL
jgi:hypothetical protein